MNGVGGRLIAADTFSFDPNQPRDDKGRWRETGAEARRQGASAIDTFPPMTEAEMREFTTDEWLREMQDERVASGKSRMQELTLGSMMSGGRVKIEIEIMAEPITLPFMGLVDVTAIHRVRAKDGQDVYTYVVDPSLNPDRVQMPASVCKAIAESYDFMGHPDGKPPHAVIIDQALMNELNGTPAGKFTAGMVDSDAGSRIHINGRLATIDPESGLYEHMVDMTMPQGDQVGQTTYVATHEYGHTVDFAHHMNDADPGDWKHLTESIWKKAVDDGGMSDYGKTDVFEGFAESWAEWSLSEGKTTNEAATWYANLFSWPGSAFDEEAA